MKTLLSDYCTIQYIHVYLNLSKDSSTHGHRQKVQSVTYSDKHILDLLFHSYPCKLSEELHLIFAEFNLQMQQNSD